MFPCFLKFPLPPLQLILTCSTACPTPGLQDGFYKPQEHHYTLYSPQTARGCNLFHTFFLVSLSFSTLSTGRTHTAVASICSYQPKASAVNCTVQLNTCTIMGQSSITHGDSLLHSVMALECMADFSIHSRSVLVQVAGRNAAFIFLRNGMIFKWAAHWLLKAIFLAPMLLSSCVKSPSNIMVVIQDFILASYFIGGFYNNLKERTFLYLPVTNGDSFITAIIIECMEQSKCSFEFFHHGGSCHRK